MSDKMKAAAKLKKLADELETVLEKADNVFDVVLMKGMEFCENLRDEAHKLSSEEGDAPVEEPVVKEKTRAEKIAFIRSRLDLIGMNHSWAKDVYIDRVSDNMVDQTYRRLGGK